MSAKPFIDTNVLVYAYIIDDHRNEAATTILAAGGVVSVQVLNEFANVTRRKLKFEWDQVEAALRDITALLMEPVELTIEIHKRALQLCREHQFSISDGLIVAAAKFAGCSILLSEDMQNGRSIEGVRISNPFAAL